MTNKGYIVRGSRGKYPYHEGKHIIVKVEELFTYSDESGMQGKPKYCLVLGFIAGYRQWELFNSDWKQVLHDYVTTEFHAKDFFGRNPLGKTGLYDSWTTEKTKAFLEALLSVAKPRQLYPVGGAVNVSDFNSFTLGERKFLTGGFIKKSGKWVTTGAPSKPYYFAMNYLIAEALYHSPPNTAVHFVFDEQNVLQPRAQETFRETASIGLLGDGQRTEQMKTVSYIRSVDSEGLQLADMYCYAWNRFLTKKGQSVQEGVLRILDILTPKRVILGHPGIQIYDREAFQKILDKLPKNMVPKNQLQKEPNLQVSDTKTGPDKPLFDIRVGENGELHTMTYGAHKAQGDSLKRTLVILDGAIEDKNWRDTLSPEELNRVKAIEEA